MSPLEKARHYDEMDCPIEAAQSYEQAIIQSDADINAYLDLVLVYLESCDFGYAAHHKLPSEFEKDAYGNALRVLDSAEAKFGDHVEIKFWRHLAAFKVLGEDISDDVLRPLLNPDQSLVPFYFAYLQSEENLYRNEVIKLKIQVKPRSTCRQRFIDGIIAKVE